MPGSAWWMVLSGQIRNSAPANSTLPTLDSTRLPGRAALSRAVAGRSALP